MMTIRQPGIHFVSFLLLPVFLLGSLPIQCFKPARQEVPTLVLGLDGAAWKFIDPLLDTGRLPHLKRLIDQGVSGSLTTLVPTQSVIIWSTILTGCLPEKHGIKGWLSGAGDQLAITSSMRKKAALWDIATANGVKGLYVNWWTSWPVNPVSGVLVSNMIFHPNVPQKIFPATMETKYQAFLNSQNDRVKLALKKQKSASGAEVDQSPIFVKDEVLFQLTEKMILDDQHSLIALYVRGLDITEHEHYHHFFPTEFSYTAANIDRFGNWISDYYCLLDRKIGRLISMLPHPLNVIIVSDHGMEAIKPDPPPIHKFLINNLLSELELLQIKDQYELQWSKTVIFQYDYHIPGPDRRLRINVKGRDPFGIVSPQQQKTLQSDIITRLRNLKVKQKDQPHTVSPLFEEVLPDEDGEADIFCRLNEQITPQDILLLPERQEQIDKYLTHFLTHTSGQHDEAPAGIVIMSGPAFQKGKILQNCHVADILPTILHIMDMPVSQEMDGEVLQAGLSKSSAAKPVRTVTAYSGSTQLQVLTRPQKDLSLPPNVEREFRDDLRSLGYIQ
ncbi:alkaline phosphatase family protein [candidate division CSSED10-310 bacterium]|uniref:Alkaline phosphatase family protein n=1 Tax=candidate division CSSED10-310 bacterium TaxID=2855610 RepID=A0ABV6Z3U6_UNCC1